ncbi:MAG: hypothetical protein JSR87_01625 [Proteobacteria bacterium]|nr:hypothetical protein [Pseudomonadota bacterium]MBS0573952.1 hypothetical protein [Pseudomonadota bacterium]
MTPTEIERLFTGEGGAFAFARWRRPIAPVVFGVDDATLSTVKGAIEAMVALAGHRMAETDPEQGANLMVFFLRDWQELTGAPALDGLVPGLAATAARLARDGAGQYWHVRFEADGAIRAMFAFLRMQGALAEREAAGLAQDLAVRAILLWAGGGQALDDGLAALIRAAYDPVLPDASRDPSHALRLAARTGG